MSRISSGYGDGPGVDSEELVKEVLQKSGWSVKELRKAADGGRAPLLQNEVDDSLRLVDFQTHSKAYQTHYVEVKYKDKPVPYGKEGNELRHGWEKPKFDDYVEFARTYTNDPVYVFIHEGDNGVILRQKVLDMSAVSQVTDADAFGTSDAMVFFRREDFEVVTDNVSQFSAGFGQGGIAKSDVDLSPFGHEDGSQAGLGDFRGVTR